MTVSTHRNSPVPTGAMIVTRFVELAKRRALMISLLAVNVGVPAVILLVRLIAHAVAPRTYGPAGGSDVFEALVTGFMYVFGFVVSVTLGATAGAADLSEGMFRHLVITGRSRWSLYFARVPAGLMIIVPIVVTGVLLVSTVCVAAAPTTLNFDGVASMPVGLSPTGLVAWAEAHPTAAICDIGYRYVGPAAPQVVCGPHNELITIHEAGGVTTGTPATTAQIQAATRTIARQNFRAYATTFLSPPLSLLIDTGLWIVLWAVMGFLIGLGLASLMGQRTLPVVLLIVFEIILTPGLSRFRIPYLLNAQRGLIGLAMAHVEPAGLPTILGLGGVRNAVGHQLLPESTTVAILVIVAWAIGWTALGAWRMATRDA